MIPQDAPATKNRKKKKKKRTQTGLTTGKFIISYNRRFKGRSSFRVGRLKVSVVPSAPRFFLSLSSAILMSA